MRGTRLPSGTVTLLFTDIEGSTKLLHELGAEEYARALAEHRNVLREVFARHGGVEVDTQGDAFFYAFPTAPGALEAAREATETLDSTPICVRMGLHTGTPLVTDEGYVGPDVHIAARIAAAGHGGQVLLSSTTAALIGGGLLDLGEHRLKDLAGPVRLFQLGEAEFPPLRSLSPTNLPTVPSPLVGRERELQSVKGHLDDGVRLLTLTGPGGAGKTRLALQAAAEVSERFTDGVFWVPLAALRDRELVLSSIAQALGAKTSLSSYLEGKQILLVLDNFEQLVEAAPQLADLLASCPGPQFLVTSRSPLRIAAEREYRVPPLPDRDAVTLFRERAVGVEDEEGALAVCRRLDGLPLAIELAAAQTRLLPPGKLLERLTERLPVLTGGPRDAPERQRTVRATIEWSYELLSEEEKRLFTSSAVFVGGSTLEAAEEICDADLGALGSLVDQSLLHKEDGRLTMLEVVREYALERLERDPNAGKAKARHRRFFLALAEAAESELRGSQQEVWLERIDQELGNVRAALARELDEGDPSFALKVIAGLELFWDFRGYYAEGLRWLEEGLARATAATPTTSARAEKVSAVLAWRQGDLDAARVSAERAVALCRGASDSRTLAECLYTLGSVLHLAGEPVEAHSAYDESEELARETGNEYCVALNTHARGLEALQAGDCGEARTFFEEALGLGRSIGVPDVIVNAVLDLGYVALYEGRLEEATTLFVQALDENEQLRWREVVAYSLLGLAASGGDLARKATLLGAAVAAREAIGLHWWESYAKEIADRAEAELRGGLAVDVLERAVAAGRVMPPDEASAYAVSVIVGSRNEQTEGIRA